MEITERARAEGYRKAASSGGIIVPKMGISKYIKEKK
jgi:hypothetical protein